MRIFNTKYLTVILFVLAYFTSFAQIPDKSLEYFNSGNQALSQRQYFLADSLYTLSITLNPNPDTYYNRAYVKKKNNDLSGYCSDLNNATNLGDTISFKEFWAYCGKIDTTYFDISHNESNKLNYNYFEITKKGFYTQNISFQKINREKKILLSFDVIDNDTIFEYGSIELEHPVFKNGEVALLKFIQNNLKYPKEDRERNITGIVYLSFIINEKGEIKNITVVRGIKGSLNLEKEAMRVVAVMPNWIPGRYNGRPIKTKYYLPFKFSIL